MGWCALCPAMERCYDLAWYPYLHQVQPCPHFGAIQGHPISHFMTPDEELQTRRPERREAQGPPQVSRAVHDRAGIAHRPRDPSQTGGSGLSYSWARFPDLYLVKWGTQGQAEDSAPGLGGDRW